MGEQPLESFLKATGLMKLVNSDADWSGVLDRIIA